MTKNSQLIRENILFSATFEEANQLSQNLIVLHNAEHNVDTKKANKAIELYQTCLEMLPNHWQSLGLLVRFTKR